MWGVQGATVVFDAHRALDGVDLEARPGQVTAVVGGDGAGKTTLMGLLAGRLEPTSGVVQRPERRRIGYEPTSSGVWRGLSVMENLRFAGQARGMANGTLRPRIAELLARADLTGAADRLGRDLSGGMRQKLGFLMAVLHSPDLLLLDEPTTGVDPVSRVDLWRLVAESAAAGAAVVMATTYLDEAERAQQVLVLDSGRPLGSGTPAEVLAAVPGTITARDARPEAPSRDVWRRGTTFHAWFPPGLTPPPGAGRAVAVDMEDGVIALTLARRAGEQDPGAAPAGSPDSGAHHPGDGTPPTSTPPSATDDRPLVRTRGAGKSFGGHRAVVEADLEVRPGRIVGLLGANGAGKTTLIRMILGLVAVDAGTVEVFGAPPAREARERLGYLPQGMGLYGELSVGENVDFVTSTYHVSDPPPLPPALAGLRDVPVSRIGLGAQRRLAFHCALAHRPQLLVLDEPTSGVDPLARARLWDTIHDQAESGVGVLVTTHYMQEAEQCTELALMSHGRIVARGLPADIVAGRTATVVTAPDWAAAFAACTGAGLSVGLDGREVRVAGSDPETVAAVLERAGVPAEVRTEPATLEEVMVLIDTPEPVGAGSAS